MFLSVKKLHAHETLLKSNVDLVGGKYVGCCIAVKNFRKCA